MAVHMTVSDGEAGIIYDALQLYRNKYNMEAKYDGQTDARRKRMKRQAKFADNLMKKLMTSV